MDQRIPNFLEYQKMSVLAIVLENGTPHTAAMHFVYHEGFIYFSTHKGSRKLQKVETERTKASLTVGFSEQEWITAQFEGEIEKTDIRAKEIMLSKYPDDIKHFDQDTVFLKFTPTWWRYSDFKNNVYLES